MRHDLKWTILGTLAIVALLHRATVVDAPPPDPWGELLTEVEAVLTAASV